MVEGRDYQHGFSEIHPKTMFDELGRLQKARGEGVKITADIYPYNASYTTIGIVLSVLYEAIRFFQTVPVTDFLFGLEWSPQMAIRADQVGSSGAFGAIPVLAGTVMISLIAMAVAAPIGLRVWKTYPPFEEMLETGIKLRFNLFYMKAVVPPDV